MADISTITLPGGSSYNFKDAEAREILASITGSNAVIFIGVSSTEVTDGGSENPTIWGSVKTDVSTGNLLFYGTKEFIYGTDNKWHELGDQSGGAGDPVTQQEARQIVQTSLTIHIVTFAANDETAIGSTNIVSGHEGETVTIPACGFSVEGKHFTEWNTASDGTGTAYAVNDTLNIVNDITLFAQWEDDVNE